MTLQTGAGDYQSRGITGGFALEDMVQAACVASGRGDDSLGLGDLKHSCRDKLFSVSSLGRQWTHPIFPRQDGAWQGVRIAFCALLLQEFGPDTVNTVIQKKQLNLKAISSLPTHQVLSIYHGVRDVLEINKKDHDQYLAHLPTTLSFIDSAMEDPHCLRFAQNVISAYLYCQSYQGLPVDLLSHSTFMRKAIERSKELRVSGQMKHVHICYTNAQKAAYELVENSATGAAKIDQFDKVAQTFRLLYETDGYDPRLYITHFLGQALQKNPKAHNLWVSRLTSAKDAIWSFMIDVKGAEELLTKMRAKSDDRSLIALEVQWKLSSAICATLLRLVSQTEGHSQAAYERLLSGNMDLQSNYRNSRLLGDQKTKIYHHLKKALSSELRDLMGQLQDVSPSSIDDVARPASLDRFFTTESGSSGHVSPGH